MEEDARADELTPTAAAGSSVAICDSARPGTDDNDACVASPNEPAEADNQEAATRTAVAAPDAEEPGPSAAKGPGPAAVAGRASRLNRRWLRAIVATQVLLAGGIGTGGYLALRAARDSQAINRANAAAVVAAKDCVTATQPPDTSALPASVRKLNECSTGGFAAQIAWYRAVLDEAYQAGNVHVRVPSMHAAVERDNDDRSIVVLMAFRSIVSQAGMADRENSYRLRLKMVLEDGQFKIAELDQVGK